MPRAAAAAQVYISEHQQSLLEGASDSQPGLLGESVLPGPLDVGYGDDTSQIDGPRRSTASIVIDAANCTMAAVALVFSATCIINGDNVSISACPGKTATLPIMCAGIVAAMRPSYLFVVYLRSNRPAPSEAEQQAALWRRKVAAAIVGNVLEWYDFAIFGNFALEIGGQFFPSNIECLCTSETGACYAEPDPTAFCQADLPACPEESGCEQLNDPTRELLDSFMVFGAAFVMRPMGGVLMGWIGDTLGRQRALEISIALMLFPSFAMGFLPTFAQAGWVGPVLLIIIRLLQGVAAGGELVGSFLFMVEAAPSASRGFWGAICFAGANGGTALGAGVAALLRQVMDDETVYDNILGRGTLLEILAWRLCFWSGLLIGALGIFIRRGLGAEKSEEEDQDKHTSTASSQDSSAGPLRRALTQHWSSMLLVIGHVSIWSTTFYIAFVWLGSFEESLTPEEGGDSGIESPFAISFGVQCLCIAIFPLAGKLADHVGLLPVMLSASIVLFISGVPIFMLVNTGKTVNAAIAQIWLAFILAGVGAPLPAWFITRFPKHVRYTGVGIGYNVAQAIFGGSSAVIATLMSDVEFPGLLDSTGPGIYLSCIALFALCAQLIGHFCMHQSQ